jgi:REP element-mobilizing transposase RayT
MAEPPRLPAIFLPWEKSIIYFVTMCAKDRPNVLANSTVFDAIKATIALLRKWHVLAGVVMPDHVHWVVSPVEDRDLSVGDFSHGFKRVLRRYLGLQSWEWQRGCFDRLLRSDENLRSKWIYVKDNPVRDGLVQRAEEWPYYLDFINESEAGSCQLPLQDNRVQFRGIGGR